MEKQLNPGEQIVEVITVGGWYQTTEGRAAQIAWNNGQPRIIDIRDSSPSREERAAEIRREFEEQAE